MAVNPYDLSRTSTDLLQTIQNVGQDIKKKELKRKGHLGELSNLFQKQMSDAIKAWNKELNKKRKPKKGFLQKTFGSIGGELGGLFKKIDKYSPELMQAAGWIPGVKPWQAGISAAAGGMWELDEWGNKRKKNVEDAWDAIVKTLESKRWEKNLFSSQYGRQMDIFREKKAEELEAADVSTSDMLIKGVISGLQGAQTAKMREGIGEAWADSGAPYADHSIETIQSTKDTVGSVLEKGFEMDSSLISEPGIQDIIKNISSDIVPGKTIGTGKIKEFFKLLGSNKDIGLDLDEPGGFLKALIAFITSTQTLGQ